MYVENQTMKLKNLLLSGTIVALLGLMATGCNENPSEPTDGTPGPVTNLQATSLGSTSVGLSWTAPSGTGLTYNVSWAPASGGGTDSGSVSGLTSTSHSVTSGLTAGKPYTFTVRSVRGTTTSSSASITWAGAQRFTDDASNSSITLRLYDSASSNGSGLTIDPAKGGPRNITVSVGSTNVQLAMYAGSSTTNFIIGPAYAMTEYSNANAFDQNVYISDSTYLATSLNTWFSAKKVGDYISANGNVRAFTLPATVTDTRGHGFYVRTGTAGNYRFARVFIKNVGGKLLQGNPPNRYVEVEISYQTTPNVEYAKRVGMVPSPAGIASQPTGK
jgi:hypothetical protein